MTKATRQEVFARYQAIYRQHPVSTLMRSKGLANTSMERNLLPLLSASQPEVFSEDSVAWLDVVQQVAEKNFEGRSDDKRDFVEDTCKDQMLKALFYTGIYLREAKNPASRNTLFLPEPWDTDGWRLLWECVHAQAQTVSNSDGPWMAEASQRLKTRSRLKRPSDFSAVPPPPVAPATVDF
jgi:hypothetical protein